jgi:hypothetical protein
MQTSRAIEDILDKLNSNYKDYFPWAEPTKEEPKMASTS